MGIYDDLRNNVVKASDKVNNYTFGKNVNKTLENLSSSYAEVIYKRSAAEKSFNELLDHRSNIYSSLLTLVSAKYYSEKIKTNIDALSSFINAYNAINGDMLKKLNENMRDQSIYNSESANSIGYAYLELFNQLKVAFGYPEDMVFLNGLYDENVYRDSVNIEDYTDKDFFFKLDDKTRVVETNTETGETKSKVYRHGFSKSLNIYDLNIENFPDLRITMKDDSLTDNNDEFQSEFANILISTMNEIYNGDGTLTRPYIITSTQDFVKYINILTNAGETTYFYIYNDINLGNEEAVKYMTISSNIIFIGPNDSEEGVSISHGNTLQIPTSVKAINIVHDIVHTGSSTTQRTLTKLDITFEASSLLIIDSNLNLSVVAHHIVDAAANISTYEYETSNSTLFKKITISINIPNREATITLTDTSNNNIIYNAVITDSVMNNSTSRDMVLYYIGELSTISGKDLTLDNSHKPHITNDDQTNLRFEYEKYLYILADLSTLIDEEFNSESALYISENINLINSYAQSFTKIEADRESNDSSYSSNYINPISQCFSIIQYIISGSSTDSSIISTQASVEESDSTKITTRKLAKSTNRIESPVLTTLIMPTFVNENDDIETEVSISSQVEKLYAEGENENNNLDSYDIVNLLSSVVPGLTSGISILLNDLITILKEINKYIKQYSLIFSISKDYSNNLAKSLRTFYSEITNTDSSFRRFPNNIKSYDEWSDYIMNYTKDGIFNLSLLYMGIELVQRSVSSDTDFTKLSNYAVACGIRNDLWDSTVFDSSIYAIIDSEKNLIEKYDLIPSTDASLEKISTGLKTIMPNLEIFDGYDLYYTTILNGYSNSNFENAVEMIFLKKIFNDRSNIMKTINDIFNTFNSIHCGFKDLLLEDIFFKTLTDICKNDSSLLSEKDRAIINELVSNNQELVQTLINDYRQVLGLLYSGLTYADYIIDDNLKNYLLLE